MSEAPKPATLITGASVGIGLELARCFAADGADLVLVARRQAVLEKVAQDLRTSGAGEVHVIAADLADPAAPQRLFDKLAEMHVTIDVLVNNAGFGSNGDFWETDIRQQLDMIQVNIAALTHLTRLFLPGMIQRGRGRIMNLASVAGFVPGAGMSVYFASKAFVVSLSLAVNEECRGKGVTVTAVCPGPTITEFQVRANMADSPVFLKNAMTAKDVARIAYRGTLRGKPLVVTGWKNKLLVESTRLAPRALLARMVGKVNHQR